MDESMRSHTNFFARDAQGVKLVVGQTVFSVKHGRAGQLLGVTHPNQVCTVRFTDNGEVANIPAAQLKVAAWSDIRNSDRTTTVVRPPAPPARADTQTQG
ncbi:MAG: hypothetical protein KJ044_11785 [Planctomycetes bacterium]|nr:hypothetical protein [Planctomycetota bacterium]